MWLISVRAVRRLAHYSRRSFKLSLLATLTVVARRLIPLAFYGPSCYLSASAQEVNMSFASKGALSVNFIGPRMPGVVLLARDLKVLGSRLIRVAKRVGKR